MAPEDVNFYKLNSGESTVVDINAIDYYTIYKLDSEGNGYYLKIDFDRVNDVPIAIYVGADLEEISVHTKTHLFQVTKEILNLEIGPHDGLETEPTDPASPAECVIKCHREKGCYNLESNTAVLLCSTDCHISCY